MRGRGGRPTTVKGEEEKEKTWGSGNKGWLAFLGNEGGKNEKRKSQ